jgi:hypothetical protein
MKIETNANVFNIKQLVRKKRIFLCNSFYLITLKFFWFGIKIKTKKDLK